MRVTFLVLLLLLWAPAGGYGAAPRRGCPPPVEMPRLWPEEWAGLEDEAAVLINRAREQGATCRGRRHPPVGRLGVAQHLRDAARRQTRYMAVHDVWDHKVGGCEPATWVDRKQYPWKSFGQTLARGEGRNSAAQVVAGWLASTHGHCETLMNPKWQSMGVAYVRDGPVHLWTANFGDR
jgi:uncharacterized protein YkwD